MNNINNRNSYLASVSVNLMAVLAGIGYSWSSPCIPKLREMDETNPLGRPATLEEISWITSLHALGSLIGPLFTGVVSKNIGKKKTLILFSLPQVASSFIMFFATQVKHFYIARFLLGIGTGCVFSVIPSYVGEISAPSIRGKTSMINSILLTAGQSLILTVGPFVTIKTLALLTLSISCIFLFTFCFYVPESPYHYVMQGRLDKAKENIKKWGISENKEKYLVDIVQVCEESKCIQSFKAIVTSKIVHKSLIISLGLAVLQSLVGNPAIVAYQQIILDSSNNILPGDRSVLIISLLQLIGTYVSLILIDKWGRRQLLILSYLGVLLSVVSLGTYFTFISYQVNMDLFFWVPFASVLIYIIFYKMGAGPLPWTLSGEIFPPSFKPHLSTLTALVMTTVNFIVTLVFPYVNETIGLHWTMFIFAGFSVLSLVYIWFLVPETKGKSLIQIQKMLLGCNDPIAVTEKEQIVLQEEELTALNKSVDFDGR